jgi:hypothetical protein
MLTGSISIISNLRSGPLANNIRLAGAGGLKPAARCPPGAMDIIFQALYLAHKRSDRFEHGRIDIKLRALLARVTDKGVDV